MFGSKLFKLDLQAKEVKDLVFNPYKVGTESFTLKDSD